MLIFQTGEEWQRLTFMFGLVEVIGEALLQTILQWYIRFIAYTGIRTFSLYQLITYSSSSAMVFIHITRPLIPKKLRHGPEENIWFAIKRIYWPIAMNSGIMSSFQNDMLFTFYEFYGTNMFIVLMSSQLSYLCICMLLTWKNCLGPSRQTQIKFLMLGGMNLICFAKFFYFAFVNIKHPDRPGQNFLYEDAILHVLFAFSNLIGCFLLAKSAIMLEQFSEFWDVHKVLHSNFLSSMWIMLSLALSIFSTLTGISDCPLNIYRHDLA